MLQATSVLITVESWPKPNSSSKLSTIYKYPARSYEIMLPSPCKSNSACLLNHRRFSSSIIRPPLEAHDDQWPNITVSSPCSSLRGVPARGGAMAAALLLSSTLLPAKSHRLLCRSRHLQPPSSTARPGRNCLRIYSLQETKEEADTSSSTEEITEKYGLEFGLWKIFSSKDGDKGGKGKEGEGKEKSRADQAKELLAKYGGAYLATSITLSLISFSLCYLLVSAGIDVQALLSKVGIATDETGGKVGAFALAYAAHKAASPIRFPPTVALTPIVASWIGKKRAKTDN